MGYALGYFPAAYAGRVPNFASLHTVFIQRSYDTPANNGGFVPYGNPVRWFDGTKKGEYIKL
jgi:hypothetical protein